MTKDNRTVVHISKADFQWWIRALEGKEKNPTTGLLFQQGKGHLCIASVPEMGRGEQHCCLGVMAEKVCVRMPVNDHDMSLKFVSGDQILEADMSPVFTSKRAHTIQDHLMTMNDEQGKSFKQIAAYAKKRLKWSEKLSK